MKQLRFIIFFSLAALFPAFSQVFSTHLFITGLENAGPPVYHATSDSMVFTYQVSASRFQPRHVSIAFEHENFVPLREMDYVEAVDGDITSRVYYYFLPINNDIVELSAINYLYVVDGAWIEDPLNPLSTSKFSGRKLSLVKIPNDRMLLPASPLIMDDENAYSKLVRFIYYAEPEEKVFLAGSFNNWDPFMYPLSEDPVEAGKYEIVIRLLPGDYWYNYYYKGRPVPDPLNIQSSYDIEGYEHSFFSFEL